MHYAPNYKIACIHILLVQFSSITQSCPALYDPFGLKHVRRPCPSRTPRACSNSGPLSDSDAIQPYPLRSPSPPAFNPSQHQGLFQ